MTKTYQPTEKQIKNWSQLRPATMPTDEEFKATWKRQHHGKETGWGMGKREWVAQHANDHLTATVEHQIGVWQGRVDAMRGEPRAETSNYHTDPYQFGYYTGYETFDNFWPQYQKKDEFTSLYGDN